MPMYRVREIQKKYGDLHNVIPKLVNAKGQSAAGKELGLSSATINLWLKNHGYKKVIQYVRESEAQR